MKNKRIILFLVLLMALIIPLTLSYYYTKSQQQSSNPVTSTKSEAPIVKNSPSLTPMPVKEDKLSEILISCVGDCTLGTDDKFSNKTLPEVFKQKNMDFSYFFKNVKTIFEQDDLTTANLETTLTTSNDKLDKGAPPFYNFKGDPSYAKILTAGSIEAVNLSNNHINDYKAKGITDTLAALTENNIKYFGEGNKYITTIKGIKFGFLGYTGFSDDATFLTKIKNDVEELKAQGCYVIINFHWGVENNYSPVESQTHIAHFAIDNGADLIIGHHPHVIEGLESYKGKIICYSLGNFCFGGNQNPGDKDTFIFQIKFNYLNNDLKATAIKAIPCSISSVSYENDYCPTPMINETKANLLSKLNKLSPKLPFKLTDDFTVIANN